MEENIKRNKGRHIKRNVSFLLIIVLFAVVGVTLRYIPGINLFPDIVSHERVVSVKLLKSGIKNISSLTTTRYDYRATVRETSSKVYGKEYIFTFDGTIKAGVDLNKVKIKKSGEKNRKPVITVTLPAATILSHEDYNAENIYEGRGLSLKGFGKERNKLIEKKKAAVEKAEIKAGLLDKAYSRAKTQIRKFISDSYDGDVTVRFAKRSSADSSSSGESDESSNSSNASDLGDSSNSSDASESNSSEEV